MQLEGIVAGLGARLQVGWRALGQGLGPLEVGPRLAPLPGLGPRLGPPLGLGPLLESHRRAGHRLLVGPPAPLALTYLYVRVGEGLQGR